MKQLYTGLLTLCFSCLAAISFGQEGPGPLVWSNPVQIAPSFIGLIEGTVGADFSTISRRASETQTYNTSLFSLDYPVQIKNIEGGAGVFFKSDRAGGLNLQQGALVLAWEAPLGRKVRYSHLRAGVSAGFVQLSARPEDLIFEDQFNPVSGTFTGTTSDSVFLDGGTSPLRLDLGVSLLWYRTQKIKGNPELNYFLGGSIYHLNRPSIALTEFSGKPRISPRYVVFGGAKYRTRSSFDINVNSVFQHQNQSSILIWQTFIRTVFFERGVLFGNEGASLYAGVSGRMQLGNVQTESGTLLRKGMESISPFIGLEYNRTFTFGFAYNLAISDNSILIGSYGGIQFMASYVLGGQKYDRPALPFPLF